MRVEEWAQSDWGTQRCVSTLVEAMRDEAIGLRFHAALYVFDSAHRSELYTRAYILDNAADAVEDARAAQ